MLTKLIQKRIKDILVNFKNYFFAITISTILILAQTSAADLTSPHFLITDFGAVGDGQTMCTQAIQAAIDSCASAGGGYVVIPSGRFLTGTILLKNHVYLKLSPNSVLLGSKNLNDYHPLSLIYAKDAHDFGVIGQGMINGQGDSFWRGKHRPFHRPGATISFNNCRYIRIRDINIRNSAAFNIAIKRCDHVNISGISIVNEMQSPNTDGIDPISSSNVFISNCYIETGDDAICLKSEDKDKVCENIVVTNSILISDATAVKCGTASKGAIRNANFSNIIMRNTKKGIGFYMKDGGSFEDIQFSNISIETIIPDSINPNHSTNSYAIFMDIEKRNEMSNLGTIRNIMFSNINIKTFDGNCLLSGMPEQKIRDITFNNVRMRVINRSDFSSRHKPRGTRTLRNIARNDFSNISSHFTFAYIDGLNINNLVIQDETKNQRFERQAIWANEVDNININGFHQQQAIDNQKLPVFKFVNCRNVFIRGCTPISPKTPFVDLVGGLTSNITLLGNNLNKVKVPAQFLRGANKKEIYISGNREK